MQTFINKIITFSRLFRKKEFYYLLKILLIKRHKSIEDNIHYIKLATDWLLKAHSICANQGFSKLYSLRDGWYGPYAETTGYIIPTLHAVLNSIEYKKPEIEKAIIESANWLTRIQYENGAFGDSISSNPSIYKTSQELVFDTGQAIFGLICAFNMSGENKFINSAIKAADWLIRVQDENGTWSKYVYNEIPHTYYSRVSNALCELWKNTGIEKYKSSALKNIEWVIKNQLKNSAFTNCSFLPDNKPVLHVIAYTIEGLWKSGVILNDESIKKHAKKSAEVLKDIQKRDTILFSHYDTNWNPTDPTRCLTGLAQMAEIWLFIFSETQDLEFCNAADTALNYLKEKIIINDAHPNLHGGLLGSYPWWGVYFPWAIPNWGNKFFIDALLLRQKLKFQNRSTTH